MHVESSVKVPAAASAPLVVDVGARYECGWVALRCLFSSDVLVGHRLADGSRIEWVGGS